MICSSEKLQETLEFNKWRCMSAACKVITKLPRELRDMIYKYCYEPLTFLPNVIDNSTLQSHDLMHSFESHIPRWEPSACLHPLCVPDEFANEMAEIWYSQTTLSVRSDRLPSFLNDELGVLTSAGTAVTRAQREHMRSLNIRIVGTMGAEVRDDPLTWEHGAPYRNVRDTLTSLLGPFGIKHKEGFRLEIDGYAVAIITMKRYLEVLAPVVYALKDQGFVVKVANVIPPEDTWCGICEDYHSQGSRKVTDCSEVYDVPRQDWAEDKAKKSLFQRFVCGNTSGVQTSSTDDFEDGENGRESYYDSDEERVERSYFSWAGWREEDLDEGVLD